MISTVLAAHPVLVRALFWVVIALGAVLAWVLHRMRAKKSFIVLVSLSFLGPLVLTLSPASGEPEFFCTIQFSVPFQGIDTLANVAMLLPLALFATLLLRRPLRVFAVVSGLSVLIELTQALVSALGRSCDTDDWFMNTIGAALGVLTAVCIIVLEKRHDPKL
ncbi:VanZ family protein [uncultured Arthrobacter sp.]|uniref:VanZ family protein n=1 Tax=uncultured Arthrobacter sp. TaxID=114050 RepID=UPI0025D96A3E|nr:VanZ family protein [uncultured Arthrobacter sp.]